MKASVIIPAYNRPESLQRTLESLLNLSSSTTDFEIIVINNGDNPKIIEVANNFAKNGLINNIRYFFEENPGAMAARHRGVKESANDILVFIDEDIIVDKHWLSSILNAFSLNPNVAFVGGVCKPIYESPPPKWIEYFWDKTCDGGVILDALSLFDYGENVKKIKPTSIWGCNYSVRKKVFKALGGFYPDNMPQILQVLQGPGESGLSWKAEQRGYEAIYEPKALVYHEIPTSRMTVEYFDSKYFYRGICISFSEIRNNHKGSLKKERIKFGSYFSRTFRNKVSFRFQTNDANSEREMLMARFKIMERAGYVFHQMMAEKHKSVLEWILREDYLYCSTPRTI